MRTTVCTILGMTLLAVVVGCRAPGKTIAGSQDALGHWTGTYYQHSDQRSYPMLITINRENSNRIEVLSDWEVAGSRTLGHGLAAGAQLEWTEHTLLGGTDIDLHGRYVALVNGDHLEGEYYKGTSEVGRFVLRRADVNGGVLEYEPVHRGQQVRSIGASDSRRQAGSSGRSGPPPAVFFLGPCPDFSEAVATVRPGAGNVWGRPHTVATYDELFEDSRNPLGRKPGDIVVLLVALDQDARVPSKYADLLPEPWELIESRLKEGEIQELRGTARDVEVILMAAPTKSQLQDLIREGRPLAVVGHNG